MAGRKKAGIRSTNNSPGKNKEIVLSDLSADDLAIIAAGLTTLGEFFSFLSLIKLQQEAGANKGQSALTDFFT
ncbi:MULTISPECIES: hypothetical protein [Paenibacillus]|uniref:Uncharacterized protein n=2 Tax=Paenibacillus TaxID=44249 RepID=A0A919Y9W3_9BACL|nr:MULTISPECIES: hypothetical protein [Paenibacillus]GIO39324.1 hypothetical protein J41TS12_41850 [Paenibacillus antibioticophila]GIO45050.1 hypothetical protein J41TS4_48080 [Paenibacillus apis]